MTDEFVGESWKRESVGTAGETIAVVVDRERVICCVGINRGLRDARVVGIVNDVQVYGDRTPGVAADVGNVQGSPAESVTSERSVTRAATYSLLGSTRWP